jgi:hypothetical protein
MALFEGWTCIAANWGGEDTRLVHCRCIYHWRIKWLAAMSLLVVFGPFLFYSW